MEVTQRIFASEPWYLERSEPEEQFTGFLEPVMSPSGPAGRPALSYVLHTHRGDLPVYAAGVEEFLKSLVGLPVIVRGKRISFPLARIATELWIGEIQAGHSSTNV